MGTSPSHQDQGPLDLPSDGRVHPRAGAMVPARGGLRKYAWVLLLAMILAGCRSSASGLEYLHDDRHNVSCWQGGGGLSCLPDWQVVRQPTTVEAVR